MYTTFVIFAVITTISAAPLDTPAEVISASFDNPTLLSVQNSQIFLRNYKAVPAQIIQPSVTIPEGLPTTTFTNGITRFAPVSGSQFKASPFVIAAPVAVETPVAVESTVETLQNNNQPAEDTETIAVTAPLNAPAEVVEPVAFVPEVLSPFKAAVASPFTLPVTKTAFTGALTLPASYAVAAPLRAAPLRSAPIVASPYIVSPYFTQYATLETLL